MRAYVIGNGASLANTPLHLINDGFSVAMNRINLIYDKTTWRPDVYLRTDFSSVHTTTFKQDLMTNVNMGIKCYLWEAFKDGIPYNHPNHADMPTGIGDFPNVVWIPRCKHHYYHHDSSDMPRAHEWHLPEICTAYSSMNAAIQIAVIEGADEIYLLGCDLGYAANKLNHFSEDYYIDTRRMGRWDTLEVMEAHKMAIKCSPIPIYNATIGGELELYPRAIL